jgi:hypothetical protein
MSDMEGRWGLPVGINRGSRCVGSQASGAFSFVIRYYYTNDYLKDKLRHDS